MRLCECTQTGSRAVRSNESAARRYVLLLQNSAQPVEFSFLRCIDKLLHILIACGMLNIAEKGAYFPQKATSISPDYWPSIIQTQASAYFLLLIFAARSPIILRGIKSWPPIRARVISLKGNFKRIFEFLTTSSEANVIPTWAIQITSARITTYVYRILHWHAEGSDC